MVTQKNRISENKSWSSPSEIPREDVIGLIAEQFHGGELKIHTDDIEFNGIQELLDHWNIVS
ncbi:hypothetical protein [Thermohalobaculum sediminis]|uniref:hypothetical protein n=1 Tax=Thermohalobaculum sediminis TaxID=2939436 RepID=UPI0020C1380B|nr:hypothetical protein [Limibaculum sediminis]